MIVMNNMSSSALQQPHMLPDSTEFFIYSSCPGIYLFGTVVVNTFQYKIGQTYTSSTRDKPKCLVSQDTGRY
jgi:hypothetical protein